MRIFDAYVPGGHKRALEHMTFVKYCDGRALLVEAHVVGPPAARGAVRMRRYFGNVPKLEDILRVRDMLESTDGLGGMNHYANLFQEQYANLLNQIQQENT